MKNEEKELAEEVKDKINVLENQYNSEVEDAKKSLEGNKQNIVQNAKIRGNVELLLKDFTDGNVQLSKNKDIFPADLRFKGGYLANQDIYPPVGMYTSDKEKLYSNTIGNDNDDETVKLINTAGKEKTLQKNKVYPVLNDNIYIQGDRPTTSIKRIDDSNGLVYIGYEAGERVQYELPYKHGTHVLVRLNAESDDEVYQQIYKNVASVEPSVNPEILGGKILSGKNLEVHVCNTTNKGQFSNDLQSVLVADVQINKNLKIKNLPFRYIRKVLPISEKLSKYE